MPFFAFRHLTSDSDLATFGDHFAAQMDRRSKGALPLRVPLTRLQASTRVIGVFQGDAMVAGYVVHDGPGLYLLNNIPEEQRAAWLAANDAHDACELAIIWRNDGIGDIAFAFVVWPRIILDCVRTGRSMILGSGYDNPMNQRYRSARPTVIYSGPSAMTGLHTYVYVYSRLKLIATFFVSFADKFFRRLSRSTRTDPPSGQPN